MSQAMHGSSSWPQKEAKDPARTIHTLCRYVYLTLKGFCRNMVETEEVLEPEAILRAASDILVAFEWPHINQLETEATSGRQLAFLFAPKIEKADQVLYTITK